MLRAAGLLLALAAAATEDSKVSCVLSPWSGFSPCEMACGNAVGLRAGACGCFAYRSRVVLQVPSADAPSKTV